MSEIKTRIGLEIHIELKTRAKMFCGCKNEDTNIPNKNICHICLGYPGVLPVPNKDAIFKTLKLGLALNCEIPRESKFDRKHYFYPDLPKNYQISQFDMPFAKNGFLEIDGKKIRIKRVHLEEDAGKLIHPKGVPYSLVDFNRSGVPLVEVVTEPDIESPFEAKRFLKDLKCIARYLKISQADMEKGHLRCDANISAYKEKTTTPIFEIKNMNSFRAVEKALSFQEAYLKENFESLKNKKGKFTLAWDEEKQRTFEMRTKEEAADYRYFPEPDIPVFYPYKLFNIQKIKKSLPLLPQERREVLKKFGLEEKEVEILVSRPLWFEYFLGIATPKNAPKIADWMINEKLGVKIAPKDLKKSISLLEKGEITRYYFKQEVIPYLLKGKKLDDALGKPKKETFNIDEIIKEVLKENEDAVENYKKGKETAIQFLIGQVMKKTKGQVDPQEVYKKIKFMIK